MRRAGLVAAAVSIAAAATIWSMLEFTILSSMSREDSLLPIILSIVWGSSYAIGLALGRITTRRPSTWRLPYTLSTAALIGSLAYSLSTSLSDTLPGLLIVYSIVTLVLGLLANSTSKIAVETVPSESWSEIAVATRALVGLFHALLSLAIGRVLLAWYGYDLEAAMELLTPLAIAGAMVAGLSFHTPLIPETVLSSLEKSIDSIAFGEPPESISVPWILVVLAAIASILKMLSIQDAVSVKPEAALPVYAAFYTLGVFAGMRSSPGILSIEIFSGIIAAAIVSDPILRLAIGVAIAGAGEAGLFYHVLESDPARVGVVMAKSALASILVGLVVEGIQASLGFSYDDIIGALAVASIIAAAASSSRGPRWT